MRASGEKGDLIPQDEVELFKKIYVAYTPDLVATAARYVGMSVAEDLVQELFLKVWNQKLFLCLRHRNCVTSCLLLLEIPVWMC